MIKLTTRAIKPNDETPTSRLDEKRRGGLRGVLQQTEKQTDGCDQRLENGSLHGGVAGGNGQTVQEVSHHNLEIRQRTRKNHSTHGHSKEGNHVGNVEDPIARLFHCLQLKYLQLMTM